jgi:hypothetical protein
LTDDKDDKRLSNDGISQSLKAYENKEFLQSSEARSLRVLSEYLEPEARFEEFNIADTIVFFGSARIKS